MMTDIKDLAIALHKERSRGLVAFLVDINDALDADEPADKIIEGLNQWLPDLLAVPWVRRLIDMEQPSIVLLQEMDERIAEIEKVSAA